MLATVVSVLVVILILVVVIMIISEKLAWNRRVIHYWKRPCAGRVWRMAFPDAPKQDIRNFLHCFACDAFMFPKRIALHFRPEDRILDIYRAIYPPKRWFNVDHMELEFFASELENEFGLSANEIEAAWHEDVTLGEVFRLTRPVDE